MEQRQLPSWLRVIFNLCGPIGLAVTLMGWVKPTIGLFFMAIGVLYVLWEIGPWTIRQVRKHPVTLAGCSLALGVIMASSGFLLAHFLRVVPLRTVIQSPQVPVVQFTSASLPCANAARTPKPTLSADQEVRRRYKILDQLRNDYILENPAASPDLLAGKAYPPPEWINSRLKSLGESWRYEDRDHPYTVNQYEAMTPSELQAVVAQVVSQLRDFGKRREQAEDALEQKHPRMTNPASPQQQSAWEAWSQQENMEARNWQSQFDASLRPKCILLNNELQKRTPNFVIDSKTKSILDITLKYSGLVGPYPENELANYLQTRAAAIPTK